jgi:hypothetical protein
MYVTAFDFMGMTNNYWGVCGINSSLYALYENNPTLRGRLARGALTPTMVLAEIKTFLRILQADGKTDLLDAIRNFTRTFAGFQNFTIESYIQRIDTAVGQISSGGTQMSLLADPQFSIAMPPEAVLYYVQKVCGFDNAALIPPNSMAQEAIVGLWRNDGNNMGTYGGLRHYVYYLRGVYFSWGKQFASIDQMQRKYGGICCKISL